MKRDIKDSDANAALQKRVVFPATEQSESGTGTLTLDSTETATLEPRTYFYDLQKVIPGDPPIVNTLASGKITVLADITRNTGI